MIPIIDHRGRILGFGGRDLPSNSSTSSSSLPLFDTKKVAKYINSPETPVFSKKKSLYGISTLPNNNPSSKLVIVEGYFDAISLQELGVKGVAAMGTSLSLEQLRLATIISSMYNSNNIQQDKLPEGNVVLLLDNDDAGNQAVKRVVKLLQTYQEKAIKNKKSLDPKFKLNLSIVTLSYLNNFNKIINDEIKEFLENELNEEINVKDSAELLETLGKEKATKILNYLIENSTNVYNMNWYN